MARRNPGEILFTTAGPNIRPNPPRAVSITWDAGGEEFRVRVVGNSREDYFTNDYDDAVATAKIMAQGGEVSDKTPKSKRPKSNPRKATTKRTNSARDLDTRVAAVPAKYRSRVSMWPVGGTAVRVGVDELSSREVADLVASIHAQGFTTQMRHNEEGYENVVAIGKKQAATKRANGSRKDVLSEDARKSGYYVATYSPGDGKTRYRFFDLAEMARKGVSPQEQTYFGPLNGVHTALGLAAAKKFLNAPAKRTNTRAKTVPMADVKAAVLAGANGGYLTDVARSPALRGVHFARIEAAAEALAKAGKVVYNGATVTRTNGSRSVADPVAARELELYIENEYALVGAANSIGKAVMKNLAQKMARGTYDATKAWKGWMYLVDEGAKRYNREFGTKFGVGAFNKATREMVAVRLAEVFESEVKSGTINVSELIGKANPARRK